MQGYSYSNHQTKLPFQHCSKAAPWSGSFRHRLKPGLLLKHVHVCTIKNFSEINKRKRIKTCSNRTQQNSASKPTHNGQPEARCPTTKPKCTKIFPSTTSIYLKQHDKEAFHAEHNQGQTKPRLTVHRREGVRFAVNIHGIAQERQVID